MAKTKRKVVAEIQVYPAPAPDKWDWDVFLGGAAVCAPRYYSTRSSARRAAIRWCERMGTEWRIRE